MEEYLVSARKYRPITFESVVGQSHITSTLKNAIARGKMAHAYLFCGPRGVGKTTCARILAKSINCSSPTADIEPCDSCESCRAFNSSSSFNIHEIDAASNSSVDNMRQLTDQVRIPPQLGSYSVYIIDEVHMLSTSAFNAFLKTLEEPPKHAIFILATTEKHKVLPTILSRCQIYDFRRIKVEDIVMLLKSISKKEGVIGDDESLHLIAQKSDGCMRDALSMFDKVVSFSEGELRLQQTAMSLNVLDYDTYFIFLQRLRDGDFQGALLMFDSLLQRGFEPSIFLAGLQSHMRDMLMAKSASTLPLLEFTGTLQDRFSGEAASYEVPFLYFLMDLVSTCEERLKSSLNQRLTVELLIIRGANFYERVADSKKRTAPPLPKIESEKAPVVQPEKEVAIVEKEQIKSIKVEKVVEEEKVIESVEAVKQERAQVSSLGISIGSIVAQSARPEMAATDKEQSIEIGKKFKREVDSERVLQICSSYAESIKATKPRYYSIFASATFSEGMAILTVPNQIISEELERFKQEILEEIALNSEGSYIDFAVEIKEYQQSSENLLIKDEDKLSYMLEKNMQIGELCSRLGLDFE